MSYMVIECRRSYAILLDEEGRFLKAANLHYQVGQTVSDPVLMREPQAAASPALAWVKRGAAAAAACLLLLLGISVYSFYFSSYSSIYLAINPEVRMDLNRQGSVVNLTGTNADGERLLEGYDGRGKDKVTVADELIDRAIAMGFLSEGGQVSFRIDAPDQALFQEYGIQLRTEVSQYLSGRLAVSIEVVSSQEQQGSEPPEPPPSSAASSSPPEPASSAPASSQAPSASSAAPPASSAQSAVEPAAPVVTPPSSSYGSEDYASSSQAPSVPASSAPASSQASSAAVSSQPAPLTSRPGSGDSNYGGTDYSSSGQGDDDDSGDNDGSDYDDDGDD